MMKAEVPFTRGFGSCMILQGSLKLSQILWSFTHVNGDPQRPQPQVQVFPSQCQMAMNTLPSNWLVRSSSKCSGASLLSLIFRASP